MPPKNQSISLVLGSGGARGLAHIGVINWLEEHGYSIDSIAGCSMGALVGGIYALGKLDQFTDWVKAINTVEMLKLMDFTFAQGGLVKGDKIINTLINLTGESLIEDLSIPFTAVTADITNEKEVWIQRGPLFDAIRASISLPLLFTPFERMGVQLLDGGVLNPVPIAPTFGDHTDQTIAVNLAGAPDPSLVRNPEQEKNMISDPGNTDDDGKRSSVSSDLSETDTDKEPSIFTRKIDQFIESISSNVSATPSLNMYSVAYQAIDAMQGAIARQKLAAYPPDRVLNVPRNLCGTLEFDRAEEVIQYGYDLAEKSFSEKK